MTTNAMRETAAVNKLVAENKALREACKRKDGLLIELKKRNRELEERMDDGNYIALRYAQRLKHEFYADEDARKKRIEEDRLAALDREGI